MSISISDTSCDTVFSIGEISRLKVRTKKFKHRPYIAQECCDTEIVYSRQNENGDAILQPKSKRSASRLTFEKVGGHHRTLSSLEEDFIYAAEFGDIPTVQRILDENPALNVDFSDILGRTPLRLAVGNEHLEVVELLLDRSNLANIYEALLQAISSGHEQIAESILKHPKYQGMKKEHKHFGETDHFFNTASEDSPFSSDITPLILAAERNQFEIVQLLLLRGETIRKPHHYYCNCQECSNKLEFDQLRLAKTRLNAYRGLCSGAYISLSSKDPILTAFELAKELRGVAKVEKYYKTEYLELADQLSVYVVKLLDKVRGHDELEILINKTGRDSEIETYERLARLKLAIQYSEKKFVAHSSCQQKLVSIWYSDLRALERSNWFFRSMLVFFITFGYPFMCILYLLAPRSKIGHFLRYPCIKFIGHTMSFVVFLVMLLFSSMMEDPSGLASLSNFTEQFKHYGVFRNRSPYVLHGNQTLPPNFKLRSFTPQTINIILSIWIIGMLWQELKQVYSEGIYNYFEALYNYLDFAVLTLYITSFTLRFLTLIKVQHALEFFKLDSNWEKLQNMTAQAEEEFYWLIADRLYWDSWDPHNIAEAIFAVANVISFSRLSYILPAHELFGPMQISVAQMITDFLKFLAVFSVFFVAFMVGLHNLYWYYPKEVRNQVELVQNDITTTAEEHFGIPHITFRTVFWSLFGRGEPTAVEVEPFGHKTTETVGYWIFGAYNFCTVIVLLNMLIAMMSRSFELIQGQADTEWKFARSKLYMEYIKDESTLPIPFNIIPSPKTVFYILKTVFGCFCCCTGDEGQQTIAHPGRVVDLEMFPPSTVGGQVTPAARTNAQISWGTRENHGGPGIKHFQEKMQTSNGFVRNDSDPNIFSDKLTYKRVMKRIVKRYIFDVQRENDANDDFDEIKQDISSFRYEMLNHIAVRQLETTDNKERLEKLYAKMDTIVNQQKLVLKLSGFRPLAFDENSDNDSGSTFSQSISVHSEDDNMQGMKKRLGSPTSSLQNIPEENKMAGVSSRSKNKINVNQSVKSRDDIVFKRQSSFDRETFDSEDSTVTLTSLERADTNVQENDNVISDRDIDVEVEVKSPTPFGVFRRENKL
ncbi:short transient receptor potential channel 7-like isoform X2 [Ruditapes philippinarum]|uniref:short transient receptor potential channel 7-like isoform X2 n=1 Tax=Ruditapes philippinarum TaxID=129788 RepID=UPI00295B2F9D|nr:short transient receptor potential channel 7-like isoform X2 [Ruditapes philippinarum]